MGTTRGPYRNHNFSGVDGVDDMTKAKVAGAAARANDVVADGEYDDEDYDDDAAEEEAAELAARYDTHVSLGPLLGTSVRSAAAANKAGQAAEKKAGQAKPTGLTRDERATCEQVLDPRTRLLLFKLINSGILGSINGCVSTGKEANVYHAFGTDSEEYAIKVYKTSLSQVNQI